MLTRVPGRLPARRRRRLAFGLVVADDALQRADLEGGALLAADGKGDRAERHAVLPLDMERHRITASVQAGRSPGHARCAASSISRTARRPDSSAPCIQVWVSEACSPAK